MHRRLARAAAAAAVSLASLAVTPAFAEGTTGPSVDVKPADIQWKADPRAAGLQTAVLSGDPKQAGLYVVRVKIARGAMLKPHTHPDVRYTTVLAGEVLIGFGEAFDVAKMKAYPAGSFLVMPANAPHYVLARDGDVLIQDAGIGPTGSTPVATK
jgi:quercetin dioxygenase-like cupin family protein